MRLAWLIKVCLPAGLASCVVNNPKKAERMFDSTKVKAIDEIEISGEAKERPFDIKVYGNWNLSLDTISEQDFRYTNQKRYSSEKALSYPVGDSIILSVSKRFPNSVLLYDSCLMIKVKSHSIEMCRNQTGDSRGWSGYKLFSVDHGFLVLDQWYYESGSTTIADPARELLFNFSGHPIFSNDSIAFSEGWGEDGSYFMVCNVRQGKMFSFQVDEWDSHKFYREGNVFYFEFTSRGSLDYKKFLKVELPSQ